MRIDARATRFVKQGLEKTRITSIAHDRTRLRRELKTDDELARSITVVVDVLIQKLNLTNAREKGTGLRL